jgi:hypothetical protein
LQLIYAHLLLKTDVLGLFSTVFLDLFYFFVQQLNVLLDLVSVSLLDQQKFGVLDCGQIFVFLFRISVLDAKHCESAVIGAAVKSLIIVTYSQPFYWKSMNLDFEGLFIRVLQHLYASWLILLTEATK